METDRLKYFCAIVETGSLTAASELLGLSHSGLSKAMALLQSELETKLFRAVGRGLEVTNEGIKVYEQAKEVLVAIERMVTKKNSEELKVTKIGLTEILSLALSGEISDPLDGQIEIFDLDSGEIEVEILEERLDFGVTFVPFPQKDLEYLKIKKVKMGVFFVNEKMSSMNLSDLPFVTPLAELKNNPLSLKSRDGWPSDRDRNIKFKVSSLAIALQIATKGLAAIFMPEFLAVLLNEQRKKTLQFKKYNSNLKFEDRHIYLVKKSIDEETKEMKKVAKVIRTKIPTSID